MLCFIDVGNDLSNEFFLSLRKLDAGNCQPGDPLRVRESSRVMLEICCDSRDKLAAFDRVCAFKSDHSGNFRSNEFSRRFGALVPSSELNELFLFIVRSGVIFIEFCLDGEFRISGNESPSNDDSLMSGGNLSNEILSFPLESVSADIGVRFEFDAGGGDKFQSSNVANEFSNGSSSVMGHTIQISGVEERDLVFTDDRYGDRDRIRIERRAGDLDFPVAFRRMRLVLLDCDLNFVGGNELFCGRRLVKGGGLREYRFRL